MPLKIKSFFQRRFGPSNLRLKESKGGSGQVENHKKEGVGISDEIATNDNQENDFEPPMLPTSAPPVRKSANGLDGNQGREIEINGETCLDIIFDGYGHVSSSSQNDHDSSKLEETLSHVQSQKKTYQYKMCQSNSESSNQQEYWIRREEARESYVKDLETVIQSLASYVRSREDEIGVLQGIIRDLKNDN